MLKYAVQSVFTLRKILINYFVWLASATLGNGNEQLKSVQVTP